MVKYTELKFSYVSFMRLGDLQTKNVFHIKIDIIYIHIYIYIYIHYIYIYI